MKVLGRTKVKKTQHKNGETMPHLEITEVVLTHHNVVKNHYQDIQESYIFRKFWFRIFIYWSIAYWSKF